MQSNILILRIYNQNVEYERLMKNVHIKNEQNSVFVVYSKTISADWEYDKESRILHIRGEETFIPGILNKTVKAIEICLLLFNFDILVRSNISTVIDQVELTNLLKSIDSLYIYGGPLNIMNYIADDAGVTSDVLKNIYGLKFISGTGIILSRNLCEKIIETNQLVDTTLIDDVAMGVFFRYTTINIVSPFIIGPRYNPTSVFYRFKTSNRYNDLTDIKVQYELIKDAHFYGNYFNNHIINL